MRYGMIRLIVKMVIDISKCLSSAQIEQLNHTGSLTYAQDTSNRQVDDVKMVDITCHQMRHGFVLRTSSGVVSTSSAQEGQLKATAH